MSEGATAAVEATGGFDVSRLVPGKLYRLADAAGFLNVGLKTVKAMIARGDMKATRVHKRDQVFGSEVLSALNLRQPPPPPPAGPTERRRQAEISLDNIRAMRRTAKK